MDHVQAYSSGIPIQVGRVMDLSRVRSAVNANALEATQKRHGLRISG